MKKACVVCESKQKKLVEIFGDKYCRPCGLKVLKLSMQRLKEFVAQLKKVPQ